MGVESQKSKMLARARAEISNPTFPPGGAPRPPSRPSPPGGGRAKSGRHGLDLRMPRVQEVQHLPAMLHIARIVGQLHPIAWAL